MSRQDLLLPVLLHYSILYPYFLLPDLIIYPIFPDLPILSIVPISTNINIVDNQRDNYEFTIDLILIINAKEELRKYKQEVIGVQYLTEKMEGKDTTGALMVNTILYIIRHNLRLGNNWNITNVGNIEYSNRARGLGDKQFYTKEAGCRIVVSRIKNR